MRVTHAACMTEVYHAVLEVRLRLQHTNAVIELLLDFGGMCEP